MEQLRYMDKKTKIDYQRADGMGYSPLHHLCSTNKTIEEIWSQGLKLIPKEEIKQASKSMNKAKPSQSESDCEGDHDEDDHDDEDKDMEDSNCEHFAQEINKNTYFSRDNLLQRKAADAAYEFYQNKLIEAAEFLYSKGLKKDSKAFDNKTMFSLSLENHNFKLAEWLLSKKVSKPTAEDFEFKPEEYDESNSPLFEIAE